jgi:hypothetical protein
MLDELTIPLARILIAIHLMGSEARLAGEVTLLAHLDRSGSQPEELISA